MLIRHRQMVKKWHWAVEFVHWRSGLCQAWLLLPKQWWWISSLVKGKCAWTTVYQKHSRPQIWKESNMPFAFMISCVNIMSIWFGDSPKHSGLTLPDTLTIIKAIGLFHVHGHKTNAYIGLQPLIFQGSALLMGNIGITLEFAESDLSVLSGNDNCAPRRSN